MKVTVLSKEVIVPSSPTPCDLKTYKFSFIDQHIPPYYIPLLLYYTSSCSTTHQTITINKLKNSLSKSLSHFYPLAGRLTVNQNAVDCTDEGVEFSLARVECNLLDMMIKGPRIEELSKLVKVETSYVEQQVAIQVNMFDCGGIAVGVSMSHRIGDASSMSSFVTHWFALARTGGLTEGPVLAVNLFPPMESCRNPSLPLPFETLVTERFIFSSIVINKLKNKLKHMINPIPTRVEVVTAFIWKCGTMATSCKVSVAFHSINLRRKMINIMDHQFGNLFQLAKAVAHPTDDMATRVMKLRESFLKIDSAYVKSLMGENGVEIAKANFKQIGKCMNEEGVGVFKFGSWCRFGFNEADFGWGNPIWVSSANFSDENSIVLMDSTNDDGIEAWVVMNQGNMHNFQDIINAELLEFTS